MSRENLPASDAIRQVIHQEINQQPTRSADKPQGISVPEDLVIVLWDSAVPVQEAKGMLGLKDSVKDRAAECFVITVIGCPAKLVSGEDQAASSRTKDWILDSAALVQKGKEKISPTDVRVSEIGDNTIVRFFFPREETIQAKDKSVTFRFELGPNLVRTDFKPNEMFYQGNLAL